MCSFRRWITFSIVLCALIARSTAHAQTLSAVWDPNPPDDAVTSYEVCIGTALLTCDVQWATVPEEGTSYTFAPSPGVLYRVAVRAVGAAGPGLYAPEVTVSIPGLVQPPNQTSAVNAPISPLSLSASDPDGGTLRFSHSGLPIGLTLDPTTGVVTGTPASTGTFNVTVFVSDDLVTTSRSFAWTIASWPAAVALTSDLSSPQVAGTPITFTATASGGTGPYQFKWWVYDGSTWTMARDWSSATYTWTPPAANANYRVGIWARDATTTADVSNINLSVPYVITGVIPSTLTPGPWTITGLTSNLSSPREMGTPITFTATASGGTGPYQFKWWVFDGSTWTMARDWGSATYTWTPTAANANYRIGIWARDATTTADVNNVNWSVPYVVTGGTGQLTIVGITASVPDQIQGGTSVTFTASATGGRAPYQFKWWLYDRGEWTMVRDWGAATYTVTLWRGDRLGVWVRDSTTTADVWDVNYSVPLTIFY
jgi:Putative Ig domain